MERIIAWEGGERHQQKNELERIFKGKSLSWKGFWPGKGGERHQQKNELERIFKGKSLSWKGFWLGKGGGRAPPATKMNWKGFLKEDR